jgi:hypothetical protein
MLGLTKTYTGTHRLSTKTLPQVGEFLAERSPGFGPRPAILAVGHALIVNRIAKYRYRARVPAGHGEVGVAIIVEVIGRDAGKDQYLT